MNNERFAVPEILFRPSDVGVQEMGITESLVHSIGTTNEGKLKKSLMVICVFHIIRKRSFKVNVRSSSSVVENTLDYQSRDRKIDSPLLWSFG